MALEQRNVQAARRRPGDGGEKEQPVKRGDGATSPGGDRDWRSAEQPAGPAAGLGRGRGAARLGPGCACRGWRDEARVVFSFPRKLEQGKVRFEGKGSLEVAGSGERLAAGVGAKY